MLYVSDVPCKDTMPPPPPHTHTHTLNTLRLRDLSKRYPSAPHLPPPPSTSAQTLSPSHHNHVKIYFCARVQNLTQRPQPHTHVLKLDSFINLNLLLLLSSHPCCLLSSNHIFSGSSQTHTLNISVAAAELKHTNASQIFPTSQSPVIWGLPRLHRRFVADLLAAWLWLVGLVSAVGPARLSSDCSRLGDGALWEQLWSILKLHKMKIAKI